MPSGVFQIQAKDSVVRLGAFDAVNAIQNLSFDPTFNEENFSELGNPNFTATSLSPETSGSFEVTATGSIPSVLARLIFNYTTQAYLFDPAVGGNTYSMTEDDFENAIFDVLNLKRPGGTFDQALVVPNAQLTGFSLRADATGTASETYTFEADRQEAYYKPYHDMVSVPLITVTATTGDIPAAFSTINSGTHHIMKVFKDDEEFDSTVATWSDLDTITVTGGGFELVAPFNRLTALLYKISAGAFPTIFYPTTARFVKGDRIDVWLVNSGTTTTDANRLLKCQSADMNIDLTRDALQQIKRNDNLNTTYWRGLNYPLNITATLVVNEVDLNLWAGLEGQTLNETAAVDTIDANNLMDLVSFETQKLELRYYRQGNETALATIVVTDMDINGFGDAQQVGGRLERTIGLTGSNMTIVGTTS